MTEIWKPIPSIEGYEASSLGRIRNSKTMLVRKLCVGRRWGYPLVGISTNGKQKTFKVHRLVCETFHGPPPEGKNDTAHNDGNRTNNTPENLRWASRGENMADAIRHGTVFAARGSKNSNAKLTEADVIDIRSRPRSRGLLCDLAAQYGVSRNVIGNIRTKGSPCWNHVR